MNEGRFYGRDAIEKYYAYLFVNVNFSNRLDVADQNAFTWKAGDEAWMV